MTENKLVLSENAKKIMREHEVRSQYEWCQLAEESRKSYNNLSHETETF